MASFRELQYRLFGKENTRFSSLQIATDVIFNNKEETLIYLTKKHKRNQCPEDMFLAAKYRKEDGEPTWVIGGKNINRTFNL